MGELEKRISELCAEGVELYPGMNAPWIRINNPEKLWDSIEEMKNEFPLLPQGQAIDYPTCLRIQARRRDWFKKWLE